MKALVTVLALTGLLVDAHPSDAAGLDRIRLGTGTLTTNVAEANGYFRAHDIEIERVTASASEVMRGYVADGKVDIVDGGLDNGVAMSVDGVDVIAVTGNAYTEQEIIAQPEIESLQALRGRIVIVDAVNTQNALLLKKMLLKVGMKPDVDYQLKSVSNRRLPQLQEHKEYAAGMLTGTTAIVAKRMGFVSLGSSASMLPPILGSGSYVRKSWARDHADLLARYIAACIDAQRWLLDPANAQQVIQLLMSSSQPTVPADIAAEAYARLMHGPGALTRDLRFDTKAFANFVALRAEVEGSWGGHAPRASTLYDLSYWRAASNISRTHRH